MLTDMPARRALLLLVATTALGLGAPARAPAMVAPAVMHPAAAPAMQSPPPGLFRDFLVAQFAASVADAGYAATAYLKVLADDPGNAELTQQAFVMCVLAGRPEAASLAVRLPDQPIAALLLIDNDAKAGNWDDAARRVRALPSQGLTQILQPLLLGWVQQGAGHTDAALAGLRPFAEGARFRGIYALHAAMIADLAGRTADAARLYHAAQLDFDGLNLRLAQILASWQARQGHLGEAQHLLQSAANGNAAMTMAVPGLVAASLTRPVTRATDGIAEAYLALAVALSQQDAGDMAMLMLHLAIDLRPDFTPARLLMADILENTRQPASAQAVLAPVSDQDPLGPVIRLDRAMLASRLNHPDDALHQLGRLAHEFPASSVPDAQIGDNLSGQNRFPEAIAAYTKALAIAGPDNRAVWPLYYARGVAQERSHQWPKAEADLKRALALSPDQPSVLNYLGYSWADQDVHLAEARQMIEKALQLRPDDGAIIDSLGWVTLRQGDSQEAEKLLLRAVELEPEDPTINGHLGDAYWAAGRHLEATFQWRRALTLNPEPADAARIEMRLHETTAQTDAQGVPAHTIQ
jgi:tetratricopeptide (TPR) repeat protein